MAIYSAVPPPPDQSATPTPTATAVASAPVAAPTTPTSAINPPATPVKNGAIDIDAWTISALQSLSVSPVARGTGTPLAIPLDGEVKVKVKEPTTAAKQRVGLPDSTTPTPPRRPLSRRDSQRTREAVLKGKEGTRQRRRWENDRLINVPNVQPPLPTDWEVHPTHPVHHIPYQLAQFWDRGVRQNHDEKIAKLQATRKKQQLKTGSATGLGAGEVPRDLREAAKRSPVVRSWVRALEEPVRDYLCSSQDDSESKEHSDSEPSQEELDSAAEQMDSDDEEIVFVGRNGAMRELQEKRTTRWKKAHREVSQEKVDSGMVFDSFGSGESAAYKRWLTHSISDYYGLQSRSVTLTNPSRRVVYVGLKQVHVKDSPPPLRRLPRPLWELC